MQESRNAVFEYIFSKADDIGYMGLDSSASNKFQDELQRDEKLLEISGEQLSRNYIKDTVLNNYSKKQRYINHDDVANIFVELKASNVLGTKKDLENGVFNINYEGHSVKCTTASFNEWQTVIKRFGLNTTEDKFAFLTCGGVKKSISEINVLKDILKSYGVDCFIVKPHETVTNITNFIKLSPFKKNKNINIDQSISKSFILAAGISGTGKTRFIRKQAECSGDVQQTYCLTSVRPDWHEPSDLLGYVTRLSGQAEYVVTDVLNFIVKAWIEIENKGIELQNNTVKGNKKKQQQVRPFWLCLDEMNLAPVEQYFADYLSVLETREWIWQENNFTYKCEPLLKPSMFETIDQNKLKTELGLTGHDELWMHFVQHGVSIPFNLIVAGTVNMDETTHGFSRKVIDRALTFDFDEFFPNDFDAFFDPKTVPKILSYPIWSDGRNKDELSNTFDHDGQRSIDFLNRINTILDNTPFKLAYRALNELLLSVMTAKPDSEVALQAVWDDFLMCKVLPRIEGDIDKLTKGGEDKNIIQQLELQLSEQLKGIWESVIRPDLYRKSLQGEETIEIECRSKAKLSWMSAQLTNGFTSFWP